MSRIAAAQQLRQLGRPKEALEQLKRELADDPDSVEAHIELVWVHVALLDLSAALDAADEALALAPDDPRAMYAKSNVLGSSGKLGQALVILDEAIGLAPSYSAFHSYRGAVCLSLRRLDDALESVARSLQLDPNEAYALGVQIRVLRALGRDGEALASTRAALALHPENAQLLQHLGELALKLNDPSTAGAAFRTVLQQDPSRLEAKAGLVDALRAKSRLYRKLTTFLSWSKRTRATLKTKHARIALAAYFIVLCASFVTAMDSLWTVIVLIPLELGVIVGGLWLATYLMARFALPVFLVPVMFDSMGKHALKETLAEQWKRGKFTKLAFVFLGAAVMGFTRSPWSVMLFVSGLPLLAWSRFGKGRRNTLFRVLLSVPLVTSCVGILCGAIEHSTEVASPWFALAAGLSVALFVGMFVDNLIRKRRARSTRPTG